MIEIGKGIADHAAWRRTGIVYFASRLSRLNRRLMVLPANQNVDRTIPLTQQLHIVSAQGYLPATLVSGRWDGEETDALGRKLHDARPNGCRLQVGQLAMVIQLSRFPVHLDMGVLQALRRKGVPLRRNMQVERRRVAAVVDREEGDTSGRAAQTMGIEVHAVLDRDP
jgi:hypothetical protein